MKAYWVRRTPMTQPDDGAARLGSLLDDDAILVNFDGSRHRDDIKICVSKALHVGRVAKALGMREFLLGNLVGAIDAAREFSDALAIDIETDDGEVSREIDGKRQADIAETDNANPDFGELGKGHRCRETSFAPDVLAFVMSEVQER